MKKALSALSMLLCVLLLATSVSAASADALSLYQSAAKKTNAAASMQIKGTIKTVHDGNNIVFNYTLKQRVNDSGKLEAQMIITAKGFDYKATCYYRDGYVYCDAYSGKIKTKMSEKDAAFSMITSPSADWFDGVKVEQVDGGQQFAFKTSSKQVTKLMGGVFQTGVDGVTSATLILPYVPTRITSTVTVGSDGYLKQQKLTYTNSYSGSSSKYTFDMKFSNFDKVDSFQFPSDLDSYRLEK